MIHADLNMGAIRLSLHDYLVLMELVPKGSKRIELNHKGLFADGEKIPSSTTYDNFTVKIIVKPRVITVKLITPLLTLTARYT
jgi:hypothetical protein